MPVLMRTRNEVDVLELPERLDAVVAPELRQAINDLLARGRRRLLLDLGSVRFCDSSGLSVLVTAFRGTKESGGAVALLRVSPAAQRIIELTNLHQAFAIFDDEDAAVAALA